MFPLFVFGMLGGIQLSLALLGWLVVFVLTLSEGSRAYRGRLLGLVAGASPGALVGTAVAYLVVVAIGFGCSTMFPEGECSFVVAVSPGLLLPGYVLGAALGGVFGWRLGNDQRPA